MAGALSLSDILHRDRNSFDLVRLVAALAVIFGHSFYLFETGGFPEPVTMVVQNNFSGTLAVGVFFFLSGILVSRSMISGDPLRFLAMRSARILPGLVVCAALVCFVLGPAVSTLPLAGYFRTGVPQCVFWDEVLLFPRDGCLSLPGVFEGARAGPSPNGSIWTLGPEVICYCYVFVAGLFGLLTSRWFIAAGIALLVLVHALWPSVIPYFSDIGYTDKLKVAMFFGAGVMAFGFRDVLKLRAWPCLPLVLLAVATSSSPVSEYTLYAALFYCVLVLSGWPVLMRVRLPGDFSYGIYIYGWPIQQAAAHFFPGLTSYPSNLVTLPLALMFGVASWFLVERPVLRAVASRFGRGLRPGEAGA
ncbi:MAG: acyltransferase [Devosia nanyangense]|uniref:Acyltransferase n=1 Tax=Devosia nanyangense TaxID=1228055 RepID=A0A933NZN1_9HYPH|nr:acyltransferase [Devosia nanyangense]